MTEFRGFVKHIGVKDGKGKKPPYRPWKLYSLKVEKEDGGEYEQWFSFGFTAPTFAKGDLIKFEASQNEGGYWNVDVDTVKKSTAAPRKQPEPAQEKSQSTSSSSGNYPSKSKGGVDWNSAVARAIELTGLLHSMDALPLGGSKGKAGEAKRFDEVCAVVDKLTVKLYNDTLSLRLLETVADTVTDTKADGALPGEDEPTPGTDEEEWKDD